MRNFLILTISTVLVASACSGGTNSAESNTNQAVANAESDVPNPATEAPSEAVNVLYATAIKGDCGAIQGLLTDEMKTNVGADNAKLDGFCDSLTKKGLLESATAIGASTSGDTATVAVELRYKIDASSETEQKDTETAVDRPVNKEKTPDAQTNVQILKPGAGQKTETTEHFLRKVEDKWLLDVTPKPAKPVK